MTGKHDEDRRYSLLGFLLKEIDHGGGSVAGGPFRETQRGSNRTCGRNISAFLVDPGMMIDPGMSITATPLVMMAGEVMGKTGHCSYRKYLHCPFGGEFLRSGGHQLIHGGMVSIDSSREFASSTLEASSECYYRDGGIHGTPSMGFWIVRRCPGEIGKRRSWPGVLKVPLAHRLLRARVPHGVAARQSSLSPEAGGPAPGMRRNLAPQGIQGASSTGSVLLVDNRRESAGRARSISWRSVSIGMRVKGHGEDAARRGRHSDSEHGGKRSCVRRALRERFAGADRESAVPGRWASLAADHLTAEPVGDHREQRVDEGPIAKAARAYLSI
jgi:hypothetical protein